MRNQTGTSTRWEGEREGGGHLPLECLQVFRLGCSGKSLTDGGGLGGLHPLPDVFHGGAERLHLPFEATVAAQGALDSAAAQEARPHLPLGRTPPSPLAELPNVWAGRLVAPERSRALWDPPDGPLEAQELQRGSSSPGEGRGIRPSDGREATRSHKPVASGAFAAGVWGWGAQGAWWRGSGPTWSSRSSRRASVGVSPRRVPPACSLACSPRVAVVLLLSFLAAETSIRSSASDACPGKEAREGGDSQVLGGRTKG